MRIRKQSFVCIHKLWICFSAVYTVVYRMFSMCYWQMLSLLVDIKNFQYGFCRLRSYNCIVCNRISCNGFFKWIYVHMFIHWLYEQVLIWTYVHLKNIWIYAHVFICHVLLKRMLKHMLIWIFVHMLHT